MKLGNGKCGGTLMATSEVKITTNITCPECNFIEKVEMPTDT